MSADSNLVGTNLQQIRRRITAACERSGRSPAEVRLVGAAKRQPLERLRAACDAGLRILGENQVQEAERKIAEMPSGVEWHLIGPLQSNKAKRAARIFDCVHSVDRLKIGRALDKQAAELDRELTGLVEINLGGEETKHGFPPSDLAARIAPLADLASLRIVGLMAIPPHETDPGAARGWFRRLRDLRDEIFARAEWAGRPGWLSMGMSGDFEVAIEEGASHVRVGTVLFGPRPDNVTS